ncbi:MAG: protease complex subunit PrcB family protein [Chthonomonas sp.]|nr:protease complex subunit PrcB family protein [Chthonomonas sp.]
MKFWLALCVLLCAAFGVAQFDMQGKPVVRWSTYSSGTQCNATKYSAVALATEGDFQRYWQQNLQGCAPTDVDWNTEQIFAIHLGRRTSGGYRVFVQSIELEQNTLWVRYVEETPARGSATASVMTSPYVLIRIKRTSGVPRFVGTLRESRTIYAPVPDCRCSRGCLANCACACHRQVDYPQIVPYRTLWNGQYSGALSQMHVIMRSQREYAHYGNQYFSGQELPDVDVDWDRENLIAIHLGRRYTAGYGVRVIDVQQINRGQITVNYYEETAPMFAKQDSTSPFVWIRIPRGIGTIQVIKAPGKPLGQ